MLCSAEVPTNPSCYSEAPVTKVRLIVVSGASGSGKTTLVNLLEEVLRPRHLRRLRSVTSKNPRPGDEATYHYITKEFFQHLMTFGMFLWTKEIHGNLYGTAKQDLEQALASTDCTVAVLTPDCITKMCLASHVMGCERGAVLLLHVVSPGEEELRLRLTARGDEQASIDERLSDCREWDKYARNLGLPIVFIKNDGSLNDLKHQVEEVLKGR